jgi:hypothetical protein
VVAIAVAGLAIGGFACEVSAASLMAFLCSLPIAFVALVSPTAVSGAVGNHARCRLVRLPVPRRTGGGRERVQWHCLGAGATRSCTCSR